jgi:hypothetical protein
MDDFTLASGRPQMAPIFKRLLAADRELASAICELETLKTAILGCITASGRVRRKKFAKLAERIKSDRHA